MASVEQIQADIKAQGDVVRQLKADKVDKDQLQPQLDALAKLKEQLARLRPDDGKGKGKAKKVFTLKTPKVRSCTSSPLSNTGPS
jgi:histidyl-tRNA synthetase